jgi:uncharacterized protein (TIGR01615 family)
MCCVAAAPVMMFPPCRRDAPLRGGGRREDAVASLAFDALFGEASGGAARTPVGTPPPMFASAASSLADGLGTAAEAQEYANGAVLFRLIARQCAPRDEWEARVLAAVARAKAAGGEACTTNVLAASLRAADFDAHVVSAAGHAGAGLSLKHTFVVVDRPVLPGAPRGRAVASERTKEGPSWQVAVAAAAAGRPAPPAPPMRAWRPPAAGPAPVPRPDASHAPTTRPLHGADACLPPRRLRAHVFARALAGAALSSLSRSMSDVTIVEPHLRQHFEVGRPSPLYRRLLDDLPDVFVGGAEQLAVVVEFLCDQMSTSFMECGMSVPPWRSARALLSKWSLGEEELRGGSPPAGSPPRGVRRGGAGCAGAGTAVALAPPLPQQPAPRPPTFGRRVTDTEQLAVATAAAAKAKAAAATAAGGATAAAGGAAAAGLPVAPAGACGVARVSWVRPPGRAACAPGHSPSRQ